MPIELFLSKGLTAEDFDRVDVNKEAGVVMVVDTLGITVDASTLDLLTRVQAKQDDAIPWGYAVESVAHLRR